MDGVTDRERVLRLKSEMRENEGVCIIVKDSKSVFHNPRSIAYSNRSSVLSQMEWEWA